MERLIKSLSAVISSSSAMRSSAPDQLLGTVLAEVLKAIDGAVLGWVCLARGLSDHLSRPAVTALPQDSVYLAAVRHADKEKEVPLGGIVACPDCPCRSFLTGADPPPQYTVFDHCPHPILCEPSAGVHACVPLFAQDRPLGVLNLAKAGSATFSTVESLFLQAAANQLSAALASASLISEAQARLNETQTLLEVSHSVNSTLDLQETIRRIARAVARVLAADTVGAYLLDSDGGQLLPFVGYHVPHNLIGRIKRTPIPVKGFRLVEEGLSTKAAVYTSNAEGDVRFDHPILRSFAIRSALFVPMLAKHVVVGGFFVLWWTEEHYFTKEAVRLVEAIARQTAIAIENARLFEETQMQALAAEASEARYRQLAEHVRDTIYMLDTEGRFTYVNPAVTALLGYAPGELLGRCFTDILTPTSQLQIKEIFAGATKGNDSFNFHELAMAQQESSAVVPFEIGMVTIRDATGLVTGWHGIARNVTERRQPEQQLLQSERPGILGETASGAAHNSNNDRGTILGRSQILRQTAQKGEATWGLDAIASEVPSVPQPRPTPSAKPARILVIDDDEMIRQLISEILEGAGHTVVQAGGGREGLRLFQQERFDLVLTDVAMPECTGWEVALAIKQLAIKKITPRTPVALITGLGITADRVKLKAAGVDLVLNKPFQIDEALTLVAKGLELRSKI